jgi:hypothetical protein
VAQVVNRWCGAGYAAKGRLGPGPAWCWLTRDGMAATGLGFPAGRPALSRLAHIRAVLAARLWLEACPVPARDPGPAGIRARSAGPAMSVLSWIKLTVCLWLLRKAVRTRRGSSSSGTAWRCCG